MRSLIRPWLLLPWPPLPLMLAGLWLYSGAAQGRRRGCCAQPRPRDRRAAQSRVADRRGVPDGGHAGRRRLLDASSSRRPVCRAARELRVDPGRPDRRQRVRRRDSAMGDERRRLLPGGRHDLHLGEVRHRHLHRRARPRPAGQRARLRRTAGDFAVAYIVAHEYGHQIQHELGLFEKYGPVPTMRFELQADCFAGTWARSAYDRPAPRGRRPEEALDAALAVGDFETDDPATTAPPNSAARPGPPASSPAIPPPARSEARYRNGANRESAAKLVRFPPRSGRITRFCRQFAVDADVAQLVEHFTRNEGVAGSSPAVGLKPLQIARTHLRLIGSSPTSPLVKVAYRIPRKSLQATCLRAR